MNAPAIVWFLAPVCGLLSALLAGLVWLIEWVERRNMERYHSE